MEKKGKRKINIQKRKSLKTLEFSITDRVSFLMKAREVANKKSPLERSTRRGRCVVIGGVSDEKHTPTLSRHPSQEGNNNIIVTKELDVNYSIPVRVIVKPDYLKEFKKLFKGVSYYYSKMLPKVIAMFLIVALNWVALSSIGKTIAYYSDEEISPDNYMAAANLNFDLYSQENFSPAVTPDVSTKREIVVQNGGEMDMDYKANIEFKDESDILCSELDLKMKMNGLTIYNGKLSDFELHGLNMNSEDSDSFSFEVNINSDDNKYWSKKCDFDLVFQGDQEEVRGFSDREVISSRVESGVWENVEKHLVINKVYYDVDENHGKEKKNEWIELYNTSDEDINIKKWEICNKDKCTRIDTKATVEAGAYILISHDASTWKYWNVPDNVRTLNSLGGQFRLNNDSDMLVLKNSDGDIIDQMNWGFPDEEWSNYNENLWNPGIEDAEEGHMLGRVPTGVDTDNISDWKDLSLPEVHVIDPNGGDIWWVGHTENIYWQASSTNESADSELTIHLYYSNDSGKTWGYIGETENTGHYSFRVPLFLEDFTYFVPSSKARIKVVATGPENFMLHASDASDEDFCPPIDYDLLTDKELEALEGLGLYNLNDNNIDEGGGGDEHTLPAEVDTTTPEHLLSPEVDSPSLEEGDSNDGVEVGDGENEEGEMDTQDNRDEDGDGEDEHTPPAEVGPLLGDEELNNAVDEAEESDNEENNKEQGLDNEENNEEQGLDNEEDSSGEVNKDASDTPGEESSEEQSGQGEKEQGAPADEQSPTETSDEVSPSQEERLKPATSDSEDKVGEAPVNEPEESAEINNNDEEI